MNSFEFVFFVCIILTKFFQPKYTCKLDDMKLLASEACESIFRESITKRNSPIKKDYNNYYYNKLKRFKHFTTKCHIKGYRKAYEKSYIQICKEDYPKYGYLLLDKKYSKMKIPNYEEDYDNNMIGNDISDLNAEYLHNFRPAHLSSSLSLSVHRRLHRDKREFASKITYCCLNSCRSDVLCK